MYITIFCLGGRTVSLSCRNARDKRNLAASLYCQKGCVCVSKMIKSAISYQQPTTQQLICLSVAIVPEELAIVCVCMQAPPPRHLRIRVVRVQKTKDLAEKYWVRQKAITCFALVPDKENVLTTSGQICQMLLSG
jgi:hypothetical protein